MQSKTWNKHHWNWVHHQRLPNIQTLYKQRYHPGWNWDHTSFVQPLLRLKLNKRLSEQYILPVENTMSQQPPNSYITTTSIKEATISSHAHTSQFRFNHIHKYRLYNDSETYDRHWNHHDTSYLSSDGKAPFATWLLLRYHKWTELHWLHSLPCFFHIFIMIWHG